MAKTGNEASSGPGEQTESGARRGRSEATPLNDIARQYETQRTVPRRIHIIGTGSVGKLVAHALRGLPNPPPVTLIFHRARLFDKWMKSRKVVTVEDSGAETTQTGYDVELSEWEKRQHKVIVDKYGLDAYAVSEATGLRPHEAARTVEEQRKQELLPDESEVVEGGETRQSGPYESAVSHAPIHNLIIATKTVRTIPALSAIRHRLSRSSTICFLQNGLGVIDEVNEKVFPDERTRPNYVQGVITHGVNIPPRKSAEDPFYVVHAGHGSIYLGLLPRTATPSTASPTGTPTETLTEMTKDECDPTARYMMRTLTRSPGLCAVSYAPLELLQLQLEKLAVNAVLNPLTVLLDARNGSVLYNFAITRTMRLLLAEISLVIRNLPELAGIANVAQRFDPGRLETLVVGVAHATADNVSSMLADVREGRRTEVEYINGYIVRRGEELGVKCVVNYAIMQTVIGKCMMVQREVNEEVPIIGDRGAGLNRE